jgi:restriction endonuclease S subunit
MSSTSGADGSYILNLKREVVENLPITIPPLAQQQHIADLDAAMRGERAILTQLINNRAAEMTAIAQQLLAPAFQRPEQRAS